ncbi:MULTISPECIES: hypothetical protein [Streptomyces]|nr:hypothetical protein [Streptomyces sp. JHD 1]MCX2970136.1 hypothetical protein [Streptomyces sp. JHD 1]
MGGEAAPSDRVMERQREEAGREYRLETEGEHPVAALRERG